MLILMEYQWERPLSPLQIDFEHPKIKELLVSSHFIVIQIRDGQGSGQTMGNKLGNFYDGGSKPFSQ